MQEGIRWLGYLLLVLIVFVATVFAAYRIRGPSEAQREALALMEKDYKPKQGRNAFPLLWYMQYDVPDDQLDARMAAEVLDVQKRLDADDMTVTYPYEPSAPRLAEVDGDASRLCETGSAGCLAKVAADPESMRRTLATYPTMLARDKGFAQADYYWNEFPRDFRFVMSASAQPAQRVWLSAYALRYVEGDQGAALSDTCRNIGTWRRLHRGTNSLVDSMIAIAGANGGMHLLADMLAALPADESVPDECEAALRAIEAADVDRCSELAGEFTVSRSILRGVGAEDSSWPARAERWLLFESRQSSAWMAEQYARYCSEGAVEGRLEDVPLGATPDTPIRHRAECVASFTGCILADIASPLGIDYDARTLDFAAHLRLGATLLWLRESQAAEPIAQLFERRPAVLRSGQRRSGIDPATGMLFVDNLYKPREPFELPVASP